MSTVEAFRRLHEAGCFVMPNPWDTGSARILHQLGFPALASTSAGLAFSRGLPDQVGAVSLDATLAHLRELVDATPLPVNADLQDGFGRDLEELAASVTACVGTGVAGLSIEDATGDPAAPLHDRATAIARVRAARAAIDATGVPVVLTARCEAWLVGDPDAPAKTLDRLVAFADAGADCLFAPTVRDPDMIATLVRAVAPKPLNVIISAPGAGLTLPRLAALGVRRISLGSALARVAWAAFLSAARSLAGTDAFEGLAGAASFAEMNELFGQR
jgi:2-methylisocitrate lyase-like PEP mutase family enzyme